MEKAAPAIEPPGPAGRGARDLLRSLRPLAALGILQAALSHSGYLASGGYWYIMGFSHNRQEHGDFRAYGWGYADRYCGQ